MKLAKHFIPLFHTYKSNELIINFLIHNQAFPVNDYVCTLLKMLNEYH